METNEVSQTIKPFLRWAGGKRWFLKHLESLTRSRAFNNYHEPFLGGGAVFFHLNPQQTSYLSDLNAELVETYLAIKSDVENVIKELKKFKNTEEDYYRIRDSRYQSEVRRAARFIYLNQTSFNGIYRVNLQGVYNVPYGFRTKPFFDTSQLTQIQGRLQKAIISQSDFEVVTSNLQKNDLVFLDPPYTISHNDNGFVKYNQKLFSLEDQFRLAGLIDQIKKKKAFYILTNAGHHKIEEIFEKGDRKFKIKRASLIGGINAVRGRFEEIIFTNIM